MKKQLLALALCLCAPVSQAVAAADPQLTPPKAEGGPKTAPSPQRTHWVNHEWGHHDRPQQLNVSLGLLYNGLNLAGWYAIPIAEDGLIESINDSFDVEFGAAFGFFRGDYWSDRFNYYNVTVAGGVRWNFYLTEAWTIFPTLKLAFNFGFNGYDPSLVYPGISFGSLWRFSRAAQMRLELGFPHGLSIGISFDL